MEPQFPLPVIALIEGTRWGGEMRPEDSDYYRARAIEERWLMSDADEPAIAHIHAQLATEYEALATRLDLDDRIEGKRIEATCIRIP